MAMSNNHNPQNTANLSNATQRLNQRTQRLNQSQQRLDQSQQRLNQNTQRLDIVQQRLNQSQQRLDHNSQRLNQNTQKLISSNKNFGDQIKTNIKLSEVWGQAIVGSIKTTVNAMKAFVVSNTDSAMKYEANINRIRTNLGESGQALIEWGKQNATALGMSQGDFASLSANLGTFFSSFTSNMQTNAAMAQQYSKTIAIVAAGTGRSIEDVAFRIKSGLLGNTEAIELLVA